MDVREGATPQLLLCCWADNVSPGLRGCCSPCLIPMPCRGTLVSKAFLGEGEDVLSSSSLAENQFSRSSRKVWNMQGTP